MEKRAAFATPSALFNLRFQRIARLPQKGFRVSVPVRRQRAQANTALVMKRGFNEVQNVDTDIVFELDVLHWKSQREARQAGLHVSEPVQVTCYSRDSDRKVDFGSREQLAQFNYPKLGSDLGEKIEQFREKSEGDFGVEPVVGALRSVNYDIEQLADVITYRNNLNKIAGTPYNGRDEWEMDCVKVDNSVFLDVRKLDEGRQPNAMHKRFMYYGYRFESLCTNSADKPTCANSEFCAIIRLRMGRHRILFGGEIDCQKPAQGENPLKSYVELKTMREPRNERDFQNMYRHRFLKYWIQSYLAGVRTVVLGYRDDGGILRNFEEFETASFPRLARKHLTPPEDHRQFRGNAQGPWEPFMCLNFLNLVLTQVRRICAEHTGRTVRIRFDPQKKRLVGRLVQDSDFGSRMMSFRPAPDRVVEGEPARTVI